MSIPSLSDTIKLDDVHAGDANAGNGGDGYNFGNIDYSPSAYVANTQTVTGAYVDVSNGDHVKDWASWDGGHAGDGGDAKALGYFKSYVENTGSGGYGGSADSNGSLTSKSGGNVAAVHADTQAAQYTELMADQHGTILAGVGGNGGSGNMAKGGDISTALVHTNPSTTTTTTDTVLKCCEDHYNYDPHCDIDMSHIPV